MATAAKKPTSKKKAATTKKASTRKPPKAASNGSFMVPVKFGSLSHVATAGRTRLGVTIQASRMSVERAEDYLTGKRVNVRLKSDPNSDGDIQGQLSWDDMGNGVEVKTIADSNKIGWDTKKVTASLLFHGLDGGDVLSLDKMSGMAGAIVFDGSEPLPEPTRGRPKKNAGDDHNDPDQQEIE